MNDQMTIINRNYMDLWCTNQLLYCHFKTKCFITAYVRGKLRNGWGNPLYRDTKYFSGRDSTSNVSLSSLGCRCLLQLVWYQLSAWKGDFGIFHFLNPNNPNNEGICRMYCRHWQRYQSPWQSPKPWLTLVSPLQVYWGLEISVIPEWEGFIWWKATYLG